MPSKSEAILSSHRDAATRIIKHFSAKHKLSLKPNDALEVVALALGAANWKTLRAMAEQGRAPRMADVATVTSEPTAAPSSLAEALFKARDLATLRATVKMGYLPPERALAAYDFVVTLESQNRSMVVPGAAHWETYVEAAKKESGIRLSDAQEMAVYAMASRKLSVLAGPTGSGKATCMKVFASAMQQAGLRILDLRAYSAMGLLQAALNQLKPSTQPGSQGQLPYDAVLLDERSFENADITYALLKALPEDCRVNIVVDTSKHRLFSHVVNALKSVGNRILVMFHVLFRQVAPEREEPLAKVVPALHARLHQKLPGLPKWNNYLQEKAKTNGPLMDTQAFAFDVFAHSALTFVTSESDTDTKAEETVRLYADLMTEIGCQVLDLTKLGMRTAADITGGADVLLLDEHTFETFDSLERLANLLPTLKATCRIVVHFKEWWPATGGAKEMLQALQGPARGNIPAMRFKAGGEVRMR